MKQIVPLFLHFLALLTLAAPQQAPQQQAPFRAGVDLVEVDVTVLDKNGKPVTDLTASDFEILERGQAQRIDTIFLVTADPAIRATTPPPLSADPAAPPAAAGPVARRQLQPRVFIFIFDMQHLSAAGFDRSRNAIRSFLEDGLRPIDLAGIVVNGEMLGNRIANEKKELLGLLNGVGPPNLARYGEMRAWPRVLTEEEAVRIARNDQQALEQALTRACGERPGDCAGSTRFAIEAQIEAKSQQIAADTARDSQNTLNTFLTLARGLGRFPGPKQVLLFSEGFYTGEFPEQIKEVASLAARNRVRISTLDARGLARDLRQQNLLGEAPFVGTTDFGTNLGVDENADVLTTLALDTGGLRVRDRNNLRPALDQIAAEAGTYYMLGYSPREPFDGSYRTIQVKTKRPGLHVRARRGYLAVRVSGTAPGDAKTEPAGQEVSTAAAAAAALAPPVPATSAPAVSEAPPAAGYRLRPDGAAHVAALTKPASSGESATPDAAARLAREGWDLYSAGKVEAARDRLAEASAAGGGVWVDYALGLCEFALDHFDAAIAAWERVRKSRSDFEPVYFDLADAYRRLERSDDALAILRDAARRWPNDPEAHNAVGVVLVSREAFDDALASFNRAAGTAPTDPTAYYNLARTHHLRYLRNLKTIGQQSEAGRSVTDQDRQRAVEHYQKYIALNGPLADKAREAVSVLNWR